MMIHHVLNLNTVFRVHKMNWNINSMEQTPLEKLITVQLVKKFPALYGIRRFMSIRIRHWILSWASWIQSTLFRYVPF